MKRARRLYEGKSKWFPSSSPSKGAVQPELKPKNSGSSQSIPRNHASCSLAQLRRGWECLAGTAQHLHGSPSSGWGALRPPARTFTARPKLEPLPSWWLRQQRHLLALMPPVVAWLRRSSAPSCGLSEDAAQERLRYPQVTTYSDVLGAISTFDVWVIL